ncbi:50S ribosomal protein L17 [Myxococcota bacterium]|jgi:large subunit ribosomal protein L17|nr:50S ribosomal protein L17 [Myxococcota bacterium]
MRHNRKQVKLNRTASHRRALFRNLLSSLFLHGRIVTTEAKAKEVKRRADILIGSARKGGLHQRRLAAAQLFGAEAVQALFDRWAPSFPDRVSGFTRAVKLGFRQGDASQMVLVEILGAAPAAGEAPEAPQAEKD